MAIARIFDGHGWTADQYDELIKRLVDQLGLAPGKTAPGVLFHWAAVTDDGIRAVDVYESEQAADTLAKESIGPIAGEMGLAPPQVHQFEIHDLLTT